MSDVGSTVTGESLAVGVVYDPVAPGFVGDQQLLFREETLTPSAAEVQAVTIICEIPQMLLVEELIPTEGYPPLPQCRVLKGAK